MAKSQIKSNRNHPRVWFSWIASILGILIIVYVLMHYVHPGWREAREEIIFLDAKEINTINLLLTAIESKPVLSESENGAEIAVQKNVQPPTPGPRMAAPLPSDTTGLAAVRRKIYAYLTIRHQIRMGSLQRLWLDLNEFKTRQELQAILPDYPLRVQSYFWLADNWIYTEILFWALFGVIANLLYVVSESMRRGQTGFDRRELPSHWAKLAYTPFSVLIIYLAINQFGEQTLNSASFSAWQIVLAFVLGFFSGRTIELLNRLKDLILPLNRDSSQTAATGSIFSVHGQLRLIEGLTVDPNTMSQAAIKLISQTDGRLNTVKHPEPDGSFQFDALPTGDYQLVVELAHNPFPLQANQVFKLDGLTPDPFVELVLKPAPEQIL